MPPTGQVVLITGSSGRIGTALIHRLAGRFRLIGFDDPGPPYPVRPAECLPVDIESDDSGQRALVHVRRNHGAEIRAVVHLAAYYSFTGEPSPKYDSVNVRGTERLLNALQDLTVEQFVYASTMLVHAPTVPGRPLTENSPLAPRWAYPKSKLEAERTIRARHGHIPYAIFRIAGVYDDDCHLPALAQQIRRIYERRLTSHLFPGDSTHGQAVVHIDDLVDAFVRVLTTGKRHPKDLTLLIGEPETMSYAALQRELGRLIHHKEWRTFEIPKALAKAVAWLEEVALPKDREPFVKHWMIDIADDHYELDITAARALLGWKPQRRLHASLRDIVRRLRADPAHFYRTNKLKAPENLPRPLPRDASPKE